MNKKLLSTLLLICFCASIVLGCNNENKIDYNEKKGQLQISMSYDEVESILGKKNTLVAETELKDKRKIKIYTWENDISTISCLILESANGTTSYLRDIKTNADNLIAIAELLENVPQVGDNGLEVSPKKFIDAFNVLLAEYGRFELPRMSLPEDDLYIYELDDIQIAISSLNHKKCIKDIMIRGNADSDLFQGIANAMVYYLCDFDINYSTAIVSKTNLFDGAAKGGGFALHQKAVYGLVINDGKDNFYIGFEAVNDDEGNQEPTSEESEATPTEPVQEEKPATNNSSAVEFEEQQFFYYESDAILVSEAEAIGKSYLPNGAKEVRRSENAALGFLDIVYEANGIEYLVRIAYMPKGAGFDKEHVNIIDIMEY